VRTVAPETPLIWILKERLVKSNELEQLGAYLRKIFQSTASSLEVRARPRKDDSAEVYIDDEFVAIVYRDDEDGELSYNVSMAILQMDLDDL